MMTATTTIGTSRKEFLGKVPWEVAGKTGTLKGDNPKGLNNWFIGAAPLENPRIAVAVIVINPSQVSSKASHIGRLILERYLG
jgi:peptidoglycan glycosyltransferase